jgi:tRNA U34 5-methylaminomethyl-2-thiouridine-forming methyltransferase MnmC
MIHFIIALFLNQVNLIFAKHMLDNLEFITTADGSKTIFNPQIGENYHSKHGALQESKHVFLKTGLEYYLEKTNQTEITILEVGFGTGLNFLLTADYCVEKSIILNYIGIEAYPISSKMLSETGYETYVKSSVFVELVKQYESAIDQEVEINSFCRLKILKQKLEDFETKQLVDVIYFDAFAAIHQPEMWTDEALEICCRNLKQGGVFVTYAITGNLKRSMKAQGFTIEKAEGAPGKREMLRATKN